MHKKRIEDSALFATHHSAFHKIGAIVPLMMICKMTEIPPHFHLLVMVSVLLVRSLGGG